jgi:alanine racemase
MNLQNFFTEISEAEKARCRFPTGIIEIDLRKLATNISALKNFTRKKTEAEKEFIFPVKANAYGAGILPVSKFVSAEKLCEKLGVACVDEARILRENGIEIPILILAPNFPTAESLKFVAREKVEIAVSDENLLKNLNDAAAAEKKVARIHLAIDTGMGRGGVVFSEVSKLLTEIKKCRNVKLVGAMTHFPVADEIDKNSREFTRRQIEIFTDLKKEILREFPAEKIIFHAANSGAVLQHFPELFDAVRPGIATYGYPEPVIPDLKLQPILKIKTRITLIKKLPADFSIGYGRTYFTKKSERIGIVPIGYGDGLSRAASGKFSVISRGKKFPSVGRISMDQFAVRVDLNSKVGDEVFLLDEKLNTAREITDAAETISYEVLCNLGNSRRMRREYIF